LSKRKNRDRPSICGTVPFKAALEKKAEPAEEGDRQHCLLGAFEGNTEQISERPGTGRKRLRLSLALGVKAALKKAEKQKPA
jgi:hypothetical protein